MSYALWVHIADEPEGMEELLSLLDPGVQVTTGGDPPAGAGYDVLVAGVPERGLVEASPRLRALVIPWSGVPNRTRTLMAEFPHVAVHNLHHNALQVAEMAVALLLSAAKFVVPMDAALRRDDWTPRYQESPIVMLSGRHAVVLGYGALGRHTARLLKGLGMTVTGVRRGGDESSGGAAAGASSDAGDPADEVAAVGRLRELLPVADVLIVCLPLTDETRGIIGEEELRLMPDRAILVNVGRGAVVDERALYEALRDGTLHAAGLDVWYNYPTDEPGRAATAPSDYPFRQLENVVMSPHRAGAPHSTDTESMRVRALAELLNAAARGEPIPNAVDLDRGY